MDDVKPITVQALAAMLAPRPILRVRLTFTIGRFVRGSRVVGVSDDGQLLAYTMRNR